MTTTTTSQTHAMTPFVDFEGAAEPRTPYQSRAQLLRYPPGRHTPAIDVMVTDYSESAIGVIYEQGLLVGQLFVVREPHITQGHTCLYSVARCEQLEDGRHSVRLCATNQLQDRSDPFAPAPAPGISRWMKLLYLGFAINGAVAIVKMAILFGHSH
jgi:hypothetical protein